MAHSLPHYDVLVLLPSRSYLPPPPPGLFLSEFVSYLLPPSSLSYFDHSKKSLFSLSVPISIDIESLGFKYYLPPTLIRPSFSPTFLSLRSAPIMCSAHTPPQLLPRSALLLPHFLLLLNSDTIRSYALLCLCSNLHNFWLGIDSVWAYQPARLGSCLFTLSGTL